MSGLVADSRRLVDDPYLSEGRIPLTVRIGVTGHRDLADPAAVTEVIRKRIVELREDFSSAHETNVRFILYSALAEDADRLVAQAALELLASPGVELHAVLPMSQEEYEKDFERPGSLAEFRELLDHAGAVTELPPAVERDAAYEQAGRHVVDNSDVVIAVWDGHHLGLQGGTAETVRYAENRAASLLVVPATRSDHPAANVASARRAETGMRSSRVRSAYHRFNEFNRHSIEDSELVGTLTAAENQFMDAVGNSALESRALAVSAWALPRFVRADRLAMRYQRLHHSLAVGLFLLAALAITVIAVQAEAGLPDQVALVEVVLMVLALALYETGRRVGPNERWLGYRSLAEAFRASLFILLSGSGQEGSETSEESAPRALDPWYQRAFSAAWASRPYVGLERSHEAEVRRIILTAWIEDQIAYHDAAARRFRDARSRLTWLVIVLFGLTVVAGLLHALTLVPGLRSTLIVLAIALPAFGGAFAGIRDQRQLRLHGERSQRMATRLKELRQEFESQLSLAAIRRLTAQARAVMEAENIEWTGVVELQELDVVL